MLGLIFVALTFELSFLSLYSCLVNLNMTGVDIHFGTDPVPAHAGHSSILVTMGTGGNPPVQLIARKPV